MVAEPRLCDRGRRIARVMICIARARIMRDSINSKNGAKHKQIS